jgi:hypothetical protein
MIERSDDPVERQVKTPLHDLDPSLPYIPI